MGELDRIPPRFRVVAYRVWLVMMVVALLVAVGVGLFRST